eukprot:TRINITY_DN5257_c0_g2_i2.p1 TRINITY_DN5257_c0_g2~~TRINITY_DN5257_c0_g2_i2.p1  ORF type:complete len:935 (+),score=184.13 TRINITY_DN5257_c0_g2_i2:17-2821(+)
MSEEVEALGKFVFAEDSQVNISSPTLGVSVDSRDNLEYADLKAYVTHWAVEIEEISNIDQTVKWGRELVHNLYVYRCCSAALQEVKTSDDSATAQFYTYKYEILLPEIQKLQDIMIFVRKSKALFIDTLLKHKDSDKRISEGLVLKLIEILDILLKLDGLKNSKNCLEIDFLAYQSALSFLQSREPNIVNPIETYELGLFLGHRFSIINTFKVELLPVEGIAHMLQHIMTICIEFIESSRYILPEEKFCFIRVAPLLLFFVDVFDDPKRSLAKTKELNAGVVQKIIRKWPVVPLCGDTFIPTADVLKDSPSFRAFPDFLAPPAKIPAYDLVSYSSEARNDHNHFVSTFKDAMINLKELQRRKLEISWDFSKELFRMTTRGFKLLSDWTAAILGQVAYKYANPNKEDLTFFVLIDTTDFAANDGRDETEDGEGNNENKPSDNEKKVTVQQPSSSSTSSAGGSSFMKSIEPDRSTIGYERAVKYNYKSSERFAIVEFMGFIQGVSSLMREYSETLIPVLNRCMHHDIQEFVQVHLRDTIRKLIKGKKKKEPIIDDMTELLNIVVDWKSGAPLNDPVLIGKKDVTPPVLPDRAVPPSQTQTELLRACLWGFLPHRGGNKDSKAFNARQLKLFEEVFYDSYIYKYMIDFMGTMSHVTNLGDLWFREYHLEISGNTQFSIELSLPWILTNHVLEYAPKINPVMTEFLLNPLAIYNEASARALHTYKKQYLYDEVEAEVNLAFDQLIFKLCSAIYTTFKIQSSSIMLDKTLAANLENMNPVKYVKYCVQSNRYGTLLNQRHFQLLGRSIDLNRLVSQRMNNYIRENLNYAITRFEASDLTTILALDHLLNNCRLTHILLSKHLQHLDSFESILSETNESTSMVSFHGRLILHVLFDMMGNISANYVYNAITERFFRSEYLMQPPLPRVSMPKKQRAILVR